MVSHYVIFLHGLGSSGDVYSDSLPEMLNLPKDFDVKFIFPDADQIPVTLYGGAPVPAWFDLKRLPNEPFEEHPSDVQGMIRTKEKINAIIESLESKGIEPANVILAGFSQGGVMSIYAGLQYKKRIGGVLCCSGWAPFLDSPSPENQDTPVMMIHGGLDNAVPIGFARSSFDLLALSRSIDWVEFASLGHSIDHEMVIDRMREWILSLF